MTEKDNAVVMKDDAVENNAVMMEDNDAIHD